MTTTGPRRLLAALPLLVAATMARGAVPAPTVDGPIGSPGSAFLQATSFDLASVGYRQEEYFIAGTASAFASTASVGTDGRWTATPAGTAPYKTRVVVHRPINPRRFNGTVLVEWLNVSGGVDAAPGWTLAHTALIREGYAWVGVSAQYVGVEGGGGLLAVADLPLKQVDPARYGSLVHPGDSFSYDIFSQAGHAVRQGAGAFGDLRVKTLLASGESQSAFRLVTYINAIHPLAGVYDGYLVHSRGGITTAGLSEPPQPSIPVPGTAMIRTDLDVPVLTLETETDLTFLQYFAARQPDSAKFRLWEVAGAAHADTYMLANGAADLGTSPDIAGLTLTSEAAGGLITCGAPINAGPQHLVVKAAVSALRRWVRHGKAPKPAPRLEVDPGPPVAIRTDAHGNALGGIRTPAVDAPIATLTGEQPGSILCMLFGMTTPFDTATLAALYPNHAAFVARYNRSLRRAVRAGWILKPDARLMRRWAAGSAIGR